MFQLTAEEILELRIMENRLAITKEELLSASLERYIADAKFNKITGNYEAIKTEYANMMNAVGRQHGIDVTLPDQGHWIIDINQGVLRQLEK